MNPKTHSKAKKYIRQNITHFQKRLKKTGKEGDRKRLSCLKYVLRILREVERLSEAIQAYERAEEQVHADETGKYWEDD